MKSIRWPDMQSGYLCIEPLPDLRAVTHCGEAESKPGAFLKPHFHPGFEFLYVISSSASWKIHDETIDQGMGELFIAYPREIHSSAKPLGSLHHYWIGLDLEMLGEEGREMAQLLRKNHIRLLPGCHALEPILRGIMGSVITPLPHQRQVILSYLSVFFALIRQRIGIMKSEGIQSQHAHLPYTFQIQMALSYMLQNLDRNLPLAELASIATVHHASNFCVRFRREVGTTPAAYHLQLRLAEARNNLLKPTSDLTSVALQYGFSSHQHFTMAFRRAYGVTPLAWKKANEKAKPQ